jgi:sulfoxide reductase heme-binding subunit YedZ
VLWGLARQPRGFGVALIVLSLVPAAWITYAILGFVFGYADVLGADPVKTGEHLFGSWTLRFLLATLAITPLRKLTGWNWLAKHRRTLGLLTFTYASLHLLTWALVDVQIGISEFVGWADIKKDIFKRPFITIGMTCFVLMIPLAVTSTKKMMARLGKSWKKLHRVIYVIAPLAIIHFWMAVKLDVREPAIYGAIVALLLGWRWWESRKSRLRAADA